MGGKTVSPEVVALALKIADSVSRSDIECYCLMTKNRRIWWYDTAVAEPEDAEFVAEAVRYLDLRGLLVHHEADGKLVRFKKEGEA